MQKFFFFSFFWCGFAIVVGGLFGLRARVFVAMGDPDEAVAEAYRHDPPCITDAMKSLCSYLAATDLVEEAGSGRKPHVSESPGGVVTVSLTHELPHLLACAKAVLRQINAHTLPHPVEWAAANPQGDDESALCRIDAIANYKALTLTLTLSLALALALALAPTLTLALALTLTLGVPPARGTAAGNAWRQADQAARPPLPAHDARELARPASGCGDRARG